MRCDSFNLIPIGSLSFWENRLKKFGVKFITTERFGERYVAFQDPDGLELELVERQGDPINHWSFGEIHTEAAIKGFAGAVLISVKPNKTAEVLEIVLGLQCIGQEEGWLRFKSEAPIGNTIDIKLTPSVRGLMGAGTVHHIAWRANDEEDHKRWRELIQEKGFHPTEILDSKLILRHYTSMKKVESFSK